MARKPKFQVGDRVRGKQEGPGSFRSREGVVVEQGPHPGEYGVRFDDAQEIGAEFVNVGWIERIA